MDLKHIEDFEVIHRFGRNRITMRLKECELTKDVREQIATAVDQILAGRQLVLSATDIEMHGTTTKSGVIEKRVLEICEEELRQANAKILALQGDVRAYKDECGRLQKVIDEASDGISKLHHNSTRVKEARERFNKRRSGNGDL